MRVPALIFTLAALAAAPAQAQELNRGAQRLEMLGSASPACVAGSARAGDQVNATFQESGPSNGVVVIPSLVDPNTAATRGSTIELSLPLVCNTSHTVTIRSFNGGLLRDGARGSLASGGFSEIQGYDVSVGWQAQSARISPAATSASFTNSQPAKGDLVVDIVIPRGTAPLVAGTYRDAVVLEIRPAN